MKGLLLDFRLFITLVLISLLIFSLDKVGFLYFPKLVIQTITIPIQIGVYESAKVLGRQFSFLFEARYASQQASALRVQNAEVLSENAKLQKELREIKALIDQQSSLSPQVYNLDPTRVIGVGRYLLIDSGEDKGVKVGQAVLFKDQFVGSVRAVSGKTSQVILPSDPDSKISVFSQGEQGRAKGILLGQFGSEMLMDKILHQEPVEIGDLIYSEGLEGQLPRGLIIGKVSQVFTRENEVFKQAKVEGVFQTKDLDMVFVLKDR
jgi:rod shape-determining protein MreC